MPQASTMCVAEKKVGALLPYAVKRGFKILGNRNNVGKQVKRQQQGK